ncbi:CHASE domain-containing protein [Pontibacter silvestris]|uniref:CHASE domain-containing protein n=1 Tax=Pontibacter silvestris TaxID=2305183 RepID=UPI001E4453CF|nr:CHASE domain-containing protein [Pontibacter silvestris]
MAQFLKDHVVAIASFLLIFLLTLFIYTETKQKSEERRHKLFTFKADQATADIEQRMRDYIQVLIGAKALYIASDTVDRSAWRAYYETLNLEQNYPGIQGIGYSHVVWPHELEQHTEQIRNEGYSEYTVYPESKQPMYTSIIFLEPFEGRNLRAFGYDMFSDSIRRSAMTIARDTKQPALTGKVRLVQENNKDEQAGFLIYLPIYDNNADPESIWDRQRLIKGYVYSPFRAIDLMTAILKNDFDDLDIEVYDGVTMDKESLLFSTDTTLYNNASEKRLFSKVNTLSIGNHTWRIYLSGKPSLGKSGDIELPYFILAGGFIIAMLMFFVTWSLSNTRHSNHLKQTITDNATAALFIIDSKGYCTFMNPAAEEMTGYTFEEMQQGKLHDMIHHSHPDGSPYHADQCPIRTSLAISKPQRAYEDVFVRKDGSFFNVSCAVQPIQESGKQNSYAIIEVRDITDEKHAQQALIESEARFRTMADNAPVMIWMSDAWGHCIYVNKQWTDFTGQSFEDSIADNWKELIDETDYKDFREVYKKGVAEEKTFKNEMHLRRYDGQFRSIINTGSPRFGADGEYLGHIGSIIDISEIKEAEQKLKQNAELLQKLFLEVPAVVGLVRAPDYQYVLANPLYSTLYGNRSLVGKTIYEAHSEVELTEFHGRLQKVFETGEPFVGNEVLSSINNGDNGGLISGYFNMVYQPLIDSVGKVEAVLIFAVEVTELINARKELSSINEELSSKNKELLRINTDLDNFIYTASHDLKSPIANMEGLSVLLRDILRGKLGDGDKQILDMISQSIEKLKRTIADLAEITKVQKELDSAVEPLCFNNLLEDITADINSQLQEADATITTDFQVSSVLYARKNLRSIIYNLVSNAVKYKSPERPAIVSIQSYQEDGCVVLQVSDNGLGIRKEQQHKLFTMFKRLHNHVEGTGIGLYIVKRIVENSGGRIVVESEFDQGTTFKVYFKQELVKEKV